MSDTLRMMHPLKRARKLHPLHPTQQQLAAHTELSTATIERAEKGEPMSPNTIQQLCKFFGKTAQELGLMSEEIVETKIEEISSQKPSYVAVPVPSLNEAPVMFTPHHAIDILLDAEMVPEQRLGALLTVGAGHLASVLDEGWSLENLLESLQIVLKGVQAMPRFNRRKLLQLGAAAVISGIPVVDGKHVSFEERTQLCSALGENIGAGWRLFHTAGNAQVLAVGQAQLILIQQSHAMLPSQDRARFYSSVHNLMGKALLFQENYQEALNMHVNAHIAAMSTGDPWQVTQSLICQADSYQALGQHAKAIEAIEEALRIIGNPSSEEHIRSKAHLLACWADNAMSLGELTTAQERLEASSMYLDQISPSEVFDRTSWLQIAGKYALAMRDFKTAIEYYEKALFELPAGWIIRQAFILIPMMVAQACKQERDASIITAKKAISTIRTLNASSINRQFIVSAQHGLLGAFPNDVEVRKFVADIPQQLTQ